MREVNALLDSAGKRVTIETRTSWTAMLCKGGLPFRLAMYRR